MNAPLAQLVQSRIADAARHSARLRHALRQAAKARPVWHDTVSRRAYAMDATRRFALGATFHALAWSPGGAVFDYAPMLWPCVWTIGPRGVLP